MEQIPAGRIHPWHPGGAGGPALQAPATETNAKGQASA